MNINSIQKHYDKLTVRERFALMTAAMQRGDEADRAALLASTPRKTWSITVTQGLGEAFEFLGMIHVMMQLGYAATLYFTLFCEEDTATKISGMSVHDAITLLQRRILESREAWQAICSEYGVDPAWMLDGLPFVEMVEMTELFIRIATQDEPLELTDLQENINTLRDAIEHKRKEWE